MTSVYIRFLARGSMPPQRAPLIERLLARASDAGTVTDWRADALELTAPRTPMPPVASMALRAVPAARRGSESWVCLATPVHMSAGMKHVSLASDGVLQLDKDEAATLAADFNAAFDGAGVRLLVAREELLLCAFDQLMEVTTFDPETALGEDVFAFQPCGRDAPRLRRLSSEIEMWLFEHGVNRGRAARGAAPITGLWLWGGGTAATLRSQDWPLWTRGRDPFFASVGDESDTHSGIIVLADRPGTPSWSEHERRWLLPALQRMRAGRVDVIHISAAQRRFTVRKVPLFEFGQRGLFGWLRTRTHPWWESFEARMDRADSETDESR